MLLHIIKRFFSFCISRSANSNYEIAHAIQWFSTKNNFVPQETLDNVWRHFVLSQLEKGRAVLLASSEWRSRKLLNILQQTVEPPPTPTSPKKELLGPIILNYHNDNKHSWSYIYLENVWGTCMQWTWRWGCPNPLQGRHCCPTCRECCQQRTLSCQLLQDLPQWQRPSAAKARFFKEWTTSKDFL